VLARRRTQDRLNLPPPRHARLKGGKALADARVERSLYQKAVGYSYNAVKIFMPTGTEKPVYAPYVEHVPPGRAADGAAEVLYQHLGRALLGRRAAAQCSPNQINSKKAIPPYACRVNLSRTRITCVACHLPPAGVGTPSAFNFSAALRADNPDSLSNTLRSPSARPCASRSSFGAQPTYAHALGFGALHSGLGSFAD
jgi:hypothetical protein